MDELFEALTLIHAKKVKHFPVILYDSKYWGGLIIESSQFGNIKYVYSGQA